jgi:hypothetical protein
METKREYENAQGFLRICANPVRCIGCGNYVARKKESGDHLKAQHQQSTGQTGKQHENRQHGHFPVTW